MAECKHGVSLWSIRSRGPVCQCGAGSLELIRAYSSAREKAINAELREYRVREAAKQADITLMSLESMWGNVFTEKAINNIAHARNLLQDALSDLNRRAEED